MSEASYSERLAASLRTAYASTIRLRAMAATRDGFEAGCSSRARRACASRSAAPSKGAPSVGGGSPITS